MFFIFKMTHFLTDGAFNNFNPTKVGGAFGVNRSYFCGMECELISGMDKDFFKNTYVTFTKFILLIKKITLNH